MMKHRKKAVLRSLAASALSFVLLVAVLHQFAAAAEEVVTGIKFETVPSPTIIYIEDETVALRVNAAIQGATSEKDVTLDAVWSSSNTSAIKVDKGVLTAVAEGSSTIRAQYKGFTVSVLMKSEYKFDQLSLQRNGADAGQTEDVLLGDKIAYTAKALKNSQETDVTKLAAWTTSNQAVATVENGKITLVAAGEAIITAKYKGRSDKVKLKVASPYKKLELSGGKLLEFKLGDPAVIVSALAETKAGQIVDVTKEAVWTSNTPEIVSVEKGEITPLRAGTAVITAEHLGVKESLTVVARPPYEAMRLTPSADQHILLKDKDTPVQMLAEVMNHPSEPVNVTSSADWSSDNVYAATVSSTGLVQAKGIGKANIKAEYKGLSKQIAIIVYPSVTTLNTNESKVETFLNEAVKLPSVSAVTLSEETVDVSEVVDWKSSNTKVVAFEKDKWMAKGIGSATLEAELDGKTVSVSVTVNEKPLIIIPEVSDLSLVIGKDTPLPKIMVTYESGKEEDVSALVSWKTTSNQVWVKSPTIRGLLKTSATLTASYLGKSTTIRVSVEEEISKIDVSLQTVELNPGRSKSIKATGTTKSGKSITLSTKMNWKSSNEQVATVKGSTVKAVAEGTAILTGSYQGKPVQVAVVVKPKLKKLIMSEKTLALPAGSSRTVKLEAEYDNGTLLPVTSAQGTVWTSSSSAVASVKNGTITANRKGSATIKATFEGKSATIRVTVK